MSTPLFKKDARVALFGDSITHAGRYPSYLQQYYLVHLPHLGVKFYNYGAGGDTAEGALRRRFEYVLRCEPTDVCLMFGVNDIGRALYAPGATAEKIREREDLCRRHLEATAELCRSFHERGVAVTLCSSLGQDEVFPSAEGYPLSTTGTTEVLFDLFKRNADALSGEIAGTVDYFTPMQGLLRDLFSLGGPSLFRDRVHPTPLGQQLMARIFLAEQGLPAAIPTAAQLMLGWQDEGLIPAVEKRYDFEMWFRNFRWIYPHQAEKTEGLSPVERVAYWKEALAALPDPDDWTAKVYRYYVENAHRDEELEARYFTLADKLYE